MIPPEFIEEVLARVDIVEIIEPRVALKRTGQNYTGLCPFHTEKSPSFSVSQDKQFYYCFGCQASGSALKFLMEFDRMEFVAAVETLAERVGMEVPRDQRPEADKANRKRKSLYGILDQAAASYRDDLRGHSTRDRAVNYLKARGLSGEVARDFGLGYAPPGWDNLYAKLATSNHERELLIDSGMAVENKDEDKTYDRFRDRIMFPIRDLRGRTIAFGGRIIGDGKPKYLNSPETPVFHKGRELYGLYEARQGNAKLDRVLVVEGYMDVVALAQNGIGYSVATLGTATTVDHVDRLYRLVPQIIFCFDGDAAGRNAAWKALTIALTAMRDGRSARFLFVPDGDDPDSLIRREGRDKFEFRIDRATSLADFFFSHLESSLDLTAMEGKASLSSAAMPLINSIPEGVFKQLMIDALAEKTGLAVERLVEAAKEMPRPAYTQDKNMPQGPGDKSVDNRVIVNRGRSDLVEIALSMMVNQPELAQEFDSAIYERLVQEPEYALLGKTALLIREQELSSPGSLLSYFRGKPESSSFRSMIERDQLLGVSELREEFIGTVNMLLNRFETQLKQELIKQLLEKPLAQLSAEERQMINDSSRRDIQS